MNAKTAKLISKFAQRKELSLKQAKREWLSLSCFDKDKKRQEMLSELSKK